MADISIIKSHGLDAGKSFLLFESEICQGCSMCDSDCKNSHEMSFLYNPVRDDKYISLIASS